MKTQNFGVAAYAPVLFSTMCLGLAPYKHHDTLVAASVTNYGGERRNGKVNVDSVMDQQMPEDGEYTWIKGKKNVDYVYGAKRPDGKYDYEVRYDAGSGDIRWMEAMDRNYILRLESEGKLLELEPNADKEILATHAFHDKITQAMQRARIAADLKLQAEAERKAREKAERLAHEEAEKKRQLEAECQARKNAKRQRIETLHQSYHKAGLH